MIKLISILVFFITFLHIATTKEEDLKNWWKAAVFYQVYPRSFLDTDGDGVGDLNGVTDKLDYVKYIGVHGTWLSPIYKSPMKDFGYDVQDYLDIDPLFGTMGDFYAYVNRSKVLGLKVIMDFVPNHSSDQHEWFIKSENGEHPYTDYYVWVDGKGENGTDPPNNWASVFGGSAWTYSPKRKQFYLHQFLKEQPDLNFRNPLVREEMKKVVSFWLEKGVDGLRIDAVRHFFEDEQLRDEPRTFLPNVSPFEYEYYNHMYTTRLAENFDLIADWRQVFDEFEAKDGYHRLMMVESVENINNSLPYFGNDTFPLADIPFNFEFISHLKNYSTAKDVYNIITGWLDFVPENKWSNWILGNHDSIRIANRTHIELIDAYNMILLLLRGTAISYYGEEIGMVDTFVTWEQVQDPFGLRFGPDNYTKFNRDPQRSPMQWNDEEFAGFTQGNSTWLPVNENYKYVNVKTQLTNPRSHLNTYIKLVELRKQKSIAEGPVAFPVVDDNIFSFSRAVRNYAGYVVIVNFGNEPSKVNLLQAKTEEYYFSTIGIVEVMSDNLYPSVVTDYFGMPIDLSTIELPPCQGIVIRFEPLWIK